MVAIIIFMLHASESYLSIDFTYNVSYNILWISPSLSLWISLSYSLHLIFYMLYAITFLLIDLWKNLIFLSQNFFTPIPLLLKTLFEVFLSWKEFLPSPPQHFRVLGCAPACIASDQSVVNSILVAVVWLFLQHLSRTSLLF